MRQSEHDRVATLRWLWGAGLGSSLSVPNADEFSTPLHMAMAARDEAAGWWLIEHGADVIRLVVGNDHARVETCALSCSTNAQRLPTACYSATTTTISTVSNAHGTIFSTACAYMPTSMIRALAAKVPTEQLTLRAPTSVSPRPLRRALASPHAPEPASACLHLILLGAMGAHGPCAADFESSEVRVAGKGTYSQLSSILKFYRVLISSSNAG